MSEEAIVTFDSDEAATYRTDISGWVSRNGLFYGEDERAARFDGCTHVLCEGCNTPIKRGGWSRCRPCQKRHDTERFLALPPEPYTGQVVALHDNEEFFFHESDIIEYAEDHEIALTDLQLVKCEPQYADEVDPLDIYEDLLPEGGDLPNHVVEAFAQLNATLSAKKNEQPICWMAVGVRIVLPENFGA